MKEVVAKRGQEDAIKKRADLAKEGFEKALANMRELAEMATKYQKEAFDVVRKRIEENVEGTVIAGSPDPVHISTSLVERQNLTMRMSMRRFTRLTNAFSKKLENLEAAVALHFAHYNLVR